MRTLCDVCESAAAILFCAADEAALCRSCDDKVHKCNKLANRHVRVGLAAPSDVPVCDICENAPAFFYCEMDGTSLCLQCDMIVHVGVKRIHKRFLLLRQRVEFPGDKPGGTEEAAIKPMDVCCGSGNKKGRDRCSGGDAQRNHKVPSIPVASGNGDGHVKKDTNMIDLNMKPHRFHGQASNYQET